MKQRLDDLESIPGVGAKIAQRLHLIGVRRVRDLKKRSPERLYKQLEHQIGAHVDQCVLYVFRVAVYYASHRKHESAKLKWWNWKDKQPNRTKFVRAPNKAMCADGPSDRR